MQRLANLLNVSKFVCLKLYQVEWFKNDGDNVSKGMKFGKVHGKQVFEYKYRLSKKCFVKHVGVSSL